MPSRKDPDADDRGAAAIRRPDADVIDLDAERRRRARTTPAGGGQDDPSKPGAAQDEPI